MVVLEMFENLIAVVQIKSRERPYFSYVMDELDSICDNIIISDPDNLLDTSRYNYYNENIEDLTSEIDCFSPNWILSLTDDELPEYRFRVLKFSLLVNEFVNMWTFSPTYLWHDLKTERIDKLWGIEQTFPSLFRWIPEVDYKWKKGCQIPQNQPGPIEKSGLSIMELGYVTPQQRWEKYLSYLNMKGILSYATQRHYESIMDSNPELRRLSI